MCGSTYWFNTKNLFMTLAEVEIYIMRKNLNVTSRKRNIVDQRIYLYAYIYHFLKMDNLSKIGEMFAPLTEYGRHSYNEDGKIIGKQDHATIRHHLIKATDIQFDPQFIENTKELHSQIPIVIPEYKNKARNIGNIPNVKKKGKQYEITINVTRDVFYEYARKQDPEVILDFMFRHMIESAPKLNKNRNPYSKTEKI